MPVSMSGKPSPTKDASSTSPVVIPGAPRWPGNHDDFKPIHQGARTDTSMAINAVSYDVAKYKHEVKGIVPGYGGHVPRSRDQFGESAVGGLQPTPWANQRHMGAAVGHFVNAHGQTELTADEKLHQKEEERFDDYAKRNGGVMPNYTGHRPGARAVEARSAFFPVVRPGKPSSGQFNDTADFTGSSGIAGSTTGQQDSYRKRVNGVLPGYTGHVPGSIDKHGGSHFGGIPGVGKDGLNTIKVKVDEDGDFYGLNQKGHGRDHKEVTTAGGVKSGYAGHIPGARGTWGMTYARTLLREGRGSARGRGRRRTPHPLPDFLNHTQALRAPPLTSRLNFDPHLYLSPLCRP
jgi:hypothetical protein